MRILVIDDEFDLLEAVRAVLTSDGHEVVTAHDGEDGFAMLRDGPAPDVVLVDVMMPRLDGVELVRRIRRDRALAAVPVVLMSAVEKPRDPIVASCSAFLRKPFTLDQLCGAIARAQPPPSADGGAAAT